MPSACAPTSGRLASNVLIAACTRRALPSRARASRASSFSLPPSRQRPGTRTSSNTTSAVCDCADAHLLELLAHASAPGVPGGNDERRVPAALQLGLDRGDDDVHRTAPCVMPPLVIHVLVPLITHSSFASS